MEVYLQGYEGDMYQRWNRQVYQPHPITLQPQESVVVPGLVRKDQLTGNVVTEQSTKLPGSLTVCPRVVSVTSRSNTARIPRPDL